MSLWLDIYASGVNHSYSSLNPVYNGANPDDAYNQVPYEKGFQFVLFMANLLNSKADFQAIIQAYIKKYSKQSVTYEAFKEVYTNWVRDNYKDEADNVLNKIDWELWINKPGSNPDGDGLNFTTTNGTKFETMAD